MRTLLPVNLTDGFTVTFGVWLAVESDVLHHAWQIWHAPDYVGLRFCGQLANALPPWGEQVVGRRVCTEVRDANAIPSVCASDDPLVARILADEWPHDEVLPHLPA